VTGSATPPGLARPMPLAAQAAMNKEDGEMAEHGERPEVASLGRLSSRHRSRVADARRSLTIRRSELAEDAAALEEALDDLSPPYQRYRISRRAEVTSLLTLGVAEIVVADTVVQALGLTATATDLVAVAVGGAATGLAWLAGHEWAVSHDPQAAAAGQRGWRRLAVATAGSFLAVNLGVRVRYGLLAEQAGHLGSGLVAPLLSGALLTAVTAALMVVAAFVSAHAETAKEAELRVRLSRVRAELRSLEGRVGVLDPDQGTAVRLSVADQEAAAPSGSGLSTGE
jgi:hypothetical protein